MNFSQNFYLWNNPSGSLISVRSVSPSFLVSTLAFTVAPHTHVSPFSVSLPTSCVQFHTSSPPSLTSWVFRSSASQNTVRLTLDSLLLQSGHKILSVHLTTHLWPYPLHPCNSRLTTLIQPGVHVLWCCHWIISQVKWVHVDQLSPYYSPITR